MSPGRIPIPPSGKRPSSGDVDFGTGKYLIAGAHSSERTSDTSLASSFAEATSTVARSDDIGVTDDDERAEDKATTFAEDTGKDADETATDGSDDESGTATGTASDDTATFAEDCTTADELAGDVFAEDEDCTVTDDVTGAAEECGTSTAEDGITGAEADDFAAEESGAVEETGGAVAADETAVEAELTGGTS